MYRPGWIREGEPMESDGVGGSRFGGRLARWTAPSPRLQDAVIREQAMALSLLLLFMLVWLLAMALLLRFVLTPGAGWRNPELHIVLAAGLLLLLAFALNRRGHYLAAASLTVVVLFGGVFAGTHLTLLGMLEPYYSRNSVDILSYLLLPLILGAVLLPMRLLVVTLLLAAAGVAAVPAVHSHVDWLRLLQGPLSYVIAVGALLLVVSYVVNLARRQRYQMVEWREQRYRSLFEQSPDAMFLVSTDGTIEAINTAGLLLFGYEREELEGGHIRQLYASPEERAALIAKTERQGLLIDEPLRMRRKDGAVLDCLVNIRLRIDPEGRAAGYQTVVRDVTARLKQDEDVKLKGQLLDLANDVVLLVDPGGEIMYSNEAAASLTGYPIDELVGMNIRRLNTPEGAEQVPSRISAMMRQGEYNFETVWVSRDGRRIDMEVRSRAVQSRGRMLFLSVGRDITRRKSDETELRLRSELLDLATDAVMLHDYTGKLLYVNQAVTQQTGYTREELLGMSLQDVDDAETSAMMRMRMAELMNQRAIAFEAGHRRKDGVVIPVDVRARIVEWEDRGVVLSVARDISERKKADAALKAERDRAQGYLDVAAVIFVALDSRGTITLVNHRCVDMLGASEQDLIGRNWFDTCVPTQERDRVRAVFDATMRGEAVGQETYENEVVTASGELRTIAWRNVVLWGDNGRPSGTLSSGEDITERRAVERALLQSEQRFRSLFEQSIDAIFGNAPDGSRMEANQAWLDLFGYTLEDLEGMNAGDLYAREEDRSAFVRIMEEKGAVRDEVELKKKDGIVMLCQRVAFARRDSAGKVVAYQGIVRDITAQRRAERELRESEERYRALFEQSLDAIWTLRPDGTGHVVNQAWLDMFGYTREDLSTLNAVDLYVNPVDRDDFLRRISQSGSVRDTVWFKRKDGTHVLCERTVVARRDDAGRIVAFQGVNRDITVAEQHKAALADELTRRRLLVEQSRDGIVVLDERGALVETNLTFARMLGYSMDEMHRLHVWDWDIPLSHETLLEMLATVDEKGDHFETRHRRKDGSVYDVEISSNGAVVGGRKLIFCVCRDISARKGAERELREREEKYRALFEQSLDPVCLVAADGTLLEANPAYLNLFGYEPADVGRVNVRGHYVNPAERDEYLRLLERDGAVIDRHAKLTRTDGSVMDCIRSSVAYRDESGRIVSIQTVTRDVTELLRAEGDLRRSEEKYRLLFEQSMDAVAIYALDGTLLDANPAHLALLGLSSADIGARNVLSAYVNPADRDEFLRLLERDGVVVDQEVRLRKVDGTEMDCVRTAVARRDAEGRLVAAQTVTRDITERKRAEQELRDSETRFRTLVEHTGLGTAISRTDGTIIACNEALPAMLGYTRDEFLALRMPDVCASREQREAVLAQTLRAGHVRNIEVEFRRKDGEPLFVSMTSVLVPLGGETVVVSQFLNITERKSAELELLRSREELQRSSEQLHELTTYLAEARENERTGIARELHDQLGQALTALSMDLDGVRRTAVSSGELPVERLDRMAALLEEMVSDVRRISSELRPGILDDAGLVPAIEWQLDRFRERSGLECRLVAPTDDAGLDRAASTALFRVFQELLTNIARHSAATRVQVTFERTDGEYVLSVADNGRGITQAQVDAATSLGIIGMRERLRPLHGTVEFRRRRPRGTTVLVTVPAR